MEEKKKKTTTKSKQTTRSKNNPKKVNTKTKSIASKKTKSNVTKKTTTKKAPVKKVAPKKAVKKEVSKVEVSNEEKLEKTYVFDGLEDKNIKEVVNELEKEKVVLDDVVIERHKSNKNIIYILIVLIIVTIGLCTSFVVNEIKEEKAAKANANNIFDKVNANVNSGDRKESSELTEVDEKKYDNIKTISLKEFEDKVLNKEDMNIIVASSTCIHCLTYEPVVDEVLGELGKKIYRINIYAMTQDDVDTFRMYYEFSGTPIIFTVKDGFIKNELKGTKNKEDFKKWAEENLE